LRASRSEPITGDLVGVTPDSCVSRNGSSICNSLLEASVSQIRSLEWDLQEVSSVLF
jgi:hypothetical protein